MPYPLKPSGSSQEVAQFLRQHQEISRVVKEQQRLLFAIDATASRQPTWDVACTLTHSLLQVTDGMPQLALKLCFYRGFDEFKQTDWLTDATLLHRSMSKVTCLGGQTQIRRTLRYALKQHTSAPIKGLLFIGDAIEEPAHELIELAGQCALRKLPLFLFQEGTNGQVSDIFLQMAKLSQGAYAQFDLNAPNKLRDLLAAIAAFASGGYSALERRSDSASKLLLQQMNR